MEATLNMSQRQTLESLYHRPSQAQPSGTNSPSQIGSPSSKVKILPWQYKLFVNGDFNSLPEPLRSGFVLSDLIWDVDNSTVLHIAAIAGQLELISSIVEYNPELLHCPNSRGDLPIHVAVRAGQQYAVMSLVDSAEEQECVCQMLERGNHDNNTALHVALENRQGSLARYLVDKCPHTFYRANAQGISPLYMAIKADSWKHAELMVPQFWNLAKHMIQLTACVDAGDAERQLLRGCSVVHAAIMARNKEILADLYGKYPNDLLTHSSDENGTRPLSYAAYTGFVEGVGFLLEKFQYQAFDTDNDGSFPIHKACSGGNLEVVKVLLDHSKSMSWLPNKKGQNILHVAAERGKAEVVNYILGQQNLKNLVNMKDEDGNTPLHLATLRKHPKVVYILTWDNNVFLDLQNKNGLTALDLAEDFGQVPSFEERLTWLALRYTCRPQPPQHRVITQTSMDMSNTDIPINSQGLVLQDCIPFPVIVVHTDKKGEQKHPPKIKNKYKERLNTLLMVSTLVATVTFASGFTVPGGYHQDNTDIGMAVLIHRCAFKVFVISNIIAMFSSVLAMVILIWAHLDDLRLILLSLDFALPLLGIALAAMSVEFMTGLYVVLRPVHWLGIAVVVVGGGFLGLLLVFFVPLYSPTSRIKNKIWRHVFHVPFKLMLLACEKGRREGLF